MAQFDFISTTDKPALLAVQNPEFLDLCRRALSEQGYKIHAVDTHEEFSTRFFEVHYQVVIIDESFGGTPQENYSLGWIQRMAMNQRRHSVFFVMGASFETLNAMQAFQQSVHAVVNYTELNLLPQMIQKVVADNDLFLHTYRETAKRVAQSRF